MLLFLLVQSRSLARPRGTKQRPLQSAINISLADLPHRFGRQPQVGPHRRCGLPLSIWRKARARNVVRTACNPPPNSCSLDLLTVSLLERNLKSYPSAYMSAIQPEMALYM